LKIPEATTIGAELKLSGKAEALAPREAECSSCLFLRPWRAPNTLENTLRFAIAFQTGETVTGFRLKFVYLINF
jgi:hypothetical protein